MLNDIIRIGKAGSVGSDDKTGIFSPLLLEYGDSEPIGRRQRTGGLRTQGSRIKSWYSL